MNTTTPRKLTDEEFDAKVESLLAKIGKVSTTEYSRLSEGIQLVGQLMASTCALHDEFANEYGPKVQNGELTEEQLLALPECKEEQRRFAELLVCAEELANTIRREIPDAA